MSFMVQLHLNDLLFCKFGILDTKQNMYLEFHTILSNIFFLFSDVSVAGLGFKITISLSQYRKTPFQ